MRRRPARLRVGDLEIDSAARVVRLLRAVAPADPADPAGWPLWRQLLDRLHHLVLPAATLTLLSMAVIARYQRSAMLDVIHDEYIRTARA